MIVSQLHQSPSRFPASPNQSPARVITGIFDPLELTRTLGTLAVNERLQHDRNVCMHVMLYRIQT